MSLMKKQGAGCGWGFDSVAKLEMSDSVGEVRTAFVFFFYVLLKGSALRMATAISRPPLAGTTAARTTQASSAKPTQDWALTLSDPRRLITGTSERGGPKKILHSIAADKAGWDKGTAQSDRQSPRQSAGF